jgi:hypothetical protein
LWRNRISYFPRHLQILNRLKGDSGYFPCISGIDIDGNRIYLWTPHQDDKKQYIIDVYDLNFKYNCSTAYYNRIGDNLEVIRNNKFYTLNLDSNDKKIKDQIGRFGVFSWPHMVQCFEINPEIIGK